MAVVYHHFLQDRFEDAVPRFRTVKADTLETRLQHDYFAAYTAMLEGDVATARALAARNTEHAVERWKLKFREVVAQLDEIEGKNAARIVSTDPNREAQQSELANAEKSFEFKVENRTVTLTHRNVESVMVNYHIMDPEFAFSSNPFVTDSSNRFTVIRPARTERVALARDKDTTVIPLPAEFAKKNVLIEIAGDGMRKTQPYHAGDLKVIVAENYGRIDIADAAGKAVPKAYVKVYARLNNGTIRFFKDGYTDLRGKFDYASLNSSDQPSSVSHQGRPDVGLDRQPLRPNELSLVEKLAVLILSDEHGAAVRELNPPSE
jgi:hypothetical protein